MSEIQSNLTAERFNAFGFFGSFAIEWVNLVSIVMLCQHLGSRHDARAGEYIFDTGKNGPETGTTGTALLVPVPECLCPYRDCTLCPASDMSALLNDH